MICLRYYWFTQIQLYRLLRLVIIPRKISPNCLFQKMGITGDFDNCEICHLHSAYHRGLRRCSRGEGTADFVEQPRRRPQSVAIAQSAFEIQMHVVLPGKSDPAMCLNSLCGYEPVRVIAYRFSQLDYQTVAPPVVNLFHGAVCQTLGHRRFYKHVRQFMLDGLEAAYWPLKLDSLFAVLNAHLQNPIASSQHFRAQPNLRHG